MGKIETKSKSWKYGKNWEKIRRKKTEKNKKKQEKHKKHKKSGNLQNSKKKMLGIIFLFEDWKFIIIFQPCAFILSLIPQKCPVYKTNSVHCSHWTLFWIIDNSKSEYIWLKVKSEKSIIVNCSDHYNLVIKMDNVGCTLGTDVREVMLVVSR